MNKKLKQKRGITLISLVVTIIVLIILAGISISLLFGKSGIITRAKKGQEIADVATAQEKLELIKSEIPIKILEGKDSTVNLNNYLEELNKDKNKKDCDVTNIEKLNDINAEITISGKYKFLAKDEENGNTYFGIYTIKNGATDYENIKVHNTSGKWSNFSSWEYPMVIMFNLKSGNWRVDASGNVLKSY